MIQILVQYFILNGHLDLVNIGSLKLVKKEAFWQNDTLVAPAEDIIFDSVFNKPSRFFYNYLADELGISTDQAALKFEEFINNISKENATEVQFGNLGILKKDNTLYSWTSNYNSTAYYKDVQIAKSNSSNHDDQVIVNSNKWGIWALILFLIAIALILFKQ